jgi:hypothetical protein
MTLMLRITNMLGKDLSVNIPSDIAYDLRRGLPVAAVVDSAAVI